MIAQNDLPKLIMELIIEDIIYVMSVAAGTLLVISISNKLFAKAKLYKTDSLHEQIFKHELSRRPPLETVVADSVNKQGEKQ